MEFTIRDDVLLTTWGTDSSNSDDPINTYYHDSRAQFVVLASELSGADGDVVSLSLYINELPGRANLQDFRIRIKHTSATTTTAWEGSWINCFGPTSVAKGDLTTGEWNKFVFGTDFEWDGTSNLLIDISRDDFGWSNNGGMMRRLIDESNRMFSGRCDNCTLYANTSGTASGWSSDFIPAIKLDIEKVERVDAGRFALESTFAIDSGTRAKTTDPFAAQAGLSGTLWQARIDVGSLKADAAMVGGELYLAEVDAGPFVLESSFHDAEFVRRRWSPSDIPTALWIDGADAGTISATNGELTEWRDKSGNDRHAFPPAANRRPAYTNNYKLNDIPVPEWVNQTIRYCGVDFMNAADLMQNVPHLIVYVVARNISTSGASGDQNRPFFSMHYPTGAGFSGPRFRLYRRYGNVRNQYNPSSEDYHWYATEAGSTPNTDWSIMRSGVDFTKEPCEIYTAVNGDHENVSDTVTFPPELMTNQTHAGRSPNEDARVVAIGVPSSGSFGWFVGGVAEVIVLQFDPGEATHAKIEGYLAHKWGMEGLLPETHEYKEEAPDPDGAPTIYGPRLESEAILHGDFWLASLLAGRFETESLLSCQPWLATVIAERFDTQGGISGNPISCLEAGRFASDSELRMQDTYYGWIRDAGHNGAASRLHGDFHRIVWWQDPRPITAQQVYTCILTGHQDSTTDLALPMSSFQFRLYHHGGSYLSIVVPNAVLYAPQIAARLNGQLVVRQGYRQSDGTEQLAEMARAGQITLRHDTGARNSSATIVAGETVQFSFDAGVVKKVTKLINRTLQADGNWQFRTPPIFGLFPGDAVEVDGQSWNVIRVSVAVGRNLQTMDILSDGPS